MRMIEVRKMAKELGISDALALETTALIRNVQQKRNTAECFRTGKTHCEEALCAWRDLCLDPFCPAEDSKGGPA